jgi:hypothetical protein
MWWQKATVFGSRDNIAASLTLLGIIFHVSLLPRQSELRVCFISLSIIRLKVIDQLICRNPKDNINDPPSPTPFHPHEELAIKSSNVIFQSNPESH